MTVSARTLAVMFTDIKGFTARTAHSSREDLVSLLEQHERLVVPIAQGYGGTLIKSIGDAFLFVFESPTNAVLAGIQIQERLRAFNQVTAAKDQIELRIGINVGEVTIVNNDVFGDAVNVASRVESATEPMEIMVTHGVVLAMNQEEVGKLLTQYKLRLADSGMHSLKGVASPVQLYHIQSRTAAKRRPTAKVPVGSARSRAATTTAPRRLGRGITAASLYVVKRLCLCVCLGAIALAAAAALFMSPWLGLLAALVLALAVPWGFTCRGCVQVRLVALAVLVAFVLVVPDTPVRDLQRHIDELSSRLSRSKSPTFSLGDKLSVYLVMLSMTAVQALRGDRATATQEFYMLFDQAHTRHWHTSQAMRSCDVRAVLGSFARSLERARSNDVMMAATVVPQSSVGGEVVFGRAVLRAQAVKRSSDWEISASVTVDVAHQAGGRVRVLSAGGVTLALDTGLLTMLQDSQWLHPYTAEYDWTVSSSDPRMLQDCAVLHAANTRRH